MDSYFAAMIIQKSWKGYRIRKELEAVHECYYKIATKIDGSRVFVNLPPTSRKTLSRPKLNASDIFHPTESSDSESIDANNETCSSILETGKKLHDDSFVNPSDQIKTRNELISAKQNITMELLWVQQAIESRRNYLKIKHQLMH